VLYRIPQYTRILYMESLITISKETESQNRVHERKTGQIGGVWVEPLFGEAYEFHQFRRYRASTKGEHRRSDGSSGAKPEKMV
jgi:hypothetical protein